MPKDEEDKGGKPTRNRERQIKIDTIFAEGCSQAKIAVDFMIDTAYQLVIRKRRFKRR